MKSANVYSKQRTVSAPAFSIPRGLKFNARAKMDGIKFLKKLPQGSVTAAFFDPQYRGVLDKLGYGNEGDTRGRERAALSQMPESLISDFISGIARSLMPSGHLFLWVDKFHLLEGFQGWLTPVGLEVVDMVVWNKSRMGMGYRTRRTTEFLVVAQKPPKRAKGVWSVHNIPDNIVEKVGRNGHTHTKPVQMQADLISAVSNPGDVIIDPAAGSFSVLEACEITGRKFLGCDLNGDLAKTLNGAKEKRPPASRRAQALNGADESEKGRRSAKNSGISFGLGRGGAYGAKGGHKRSIAAFDRAIESDPQNAGAYLGRGGAYSAKGDYGRAIADFNKAIALGPQNAGAYLGRSFAYSACGNRKRAASDFEKAMTLDPQIVKACWGEMPFALSQMPLNEQSLTLTKQLHLGGGSLLRTSPRQQRG